MQCFLKWPLQRSKRVVRQKGLEGEVRKNFRSGGVYYCDFGIKITLFSNWPSQSEATRLLQRCDNYYAAVPPRDGRASLGSVCAETLITAILELRHTSGTQVQTRSSWLQLLEILWLRRPPFKTGTARSERRVSRQPGNNGQISSQGFVHCILILII